MTDLQVLNLLSAAACGIAAVCYNKLGQRKSSIFAAGLAGVNLSLYLFMSGG